MKLKHGKYYLIKGFIKAHFLILEGKWFLVPKTHKLHAWHEVQFDEIPDDQVEEITEEEFNSDKYGY